MSHILEIVGRGLLTELTAAFRDVLVEDANVSTQELVGAVERDDGDGYAFIRLGIRGLNVHDVAGARNSFERALELAPTSNVARVGLACALDESGHPQEAIKHLLKGLANQRDNAALLFGLGYCSERCGQTPEAIEYYVDALQVCPGLRNAHERLAAIYVSKGAFGGAVKHYEKLCASSSEELTCHLSLGNLYVKQGRYDEARDRYLSVLAAGADVAKSGREGANSAEGCGSAESRIAELERRVAGDRTNVAWRMELGDLLARAGRIDDAIEQYGHVVQLRPQYLDAYVKIGTCHLGRGRYESAAPWFGRAVELNDNLLAAYVGLGVSQFEAGHLRDAEATFKAASQVEPNSSMLFSEVAKLQLKSMAAEQVDAYWGPMAGGKVDAERSAPADELLDRQIAKHREGLRARPHHADLHYQLGLLLRQRGQLAGAAESFQKALSINRNYLKAIVKLGITQFEMGHEDVAVKTFRAALEDHPHDVELHYQLGLIFADQNKFVQAVEQYESALRQDGQNVDLHAHLALALQNMGLLDRAAACWETLCEAASETESGRAVLEAAAGMSRIKDFET